MLSECNSHPRDSRIVFDEAPHIYYIDGFCEGWTSTTTFVHHFFAEFNGFLAARAMVRGRKFPHGDSKYAKYIPLLEDEDGKTRTQSELIKAIQEMWKADGKRAADMGTELHKAIEDYYNGVPEPPMHPPDWPYFVEFDKERKRQGFVPYRTEWMVFIEEDQICGSIDMLMYRPSDGTYHIFDWKRSKAIRFRGYGGKKGKYCLSQVHDCNYVHYSLQLSIYRYILETKYDVKVASQRIVVMHPSNDTYKSFELPNMRDEVLAMLEHRRTPKPKHKSETFKMTDFFTMNAAPSSSRPPTKTSATSAAFALTDFFNTSASVTPSKVSVAPATFALTDFFNV